MRRSLGYGRTFRITTDSPASAIDTAVLVSNPAVTHLVDADQRNVVLPIVSRDGNSVVVKTPPSALVAPPGPYMLFVNTRAAKGLVPSKSVQTFLGLRPLEAQARRAHARSKGSMQHQNAATRKRGR